MPQTLGPLLDEQCKRTPFRVAVVCNNNTLTYRDLERRSNQFSNYLIEKGVEAGRVLGICLERSTDMLVALLGTLKAGAAYVPIDPDYPAQRIAFMLADSQASLVVTQKSLAGRLPRSGVELLCIDSEQRNIQRQEEDSPPACVKTDDLAYLIYTSGSSGKPKGVAVPHGALVNLLQSMAREPGLKSSDVLLAITTLSFDIAALELYLPLIVGARVVIANAAVTRDPASLQALMEQSGATVMQATPALWRMLVDSGWKGKPDLKMLCGGEALARDLADALLERGASLWNMYGPTETTVWSLLDRVYPDGRPITIGHPISNTAVYILDDNGQPVLPGETGELHIGGAGLARGYWNRPDLTAERFIISNFDQTRMRLYRTGDEARVGIDGHIECLGRKDNQVKIRGFRIELEEIEATLRKHAAIRDAAVIAHRNGNGAPRLAAYVVPIDASTAPGVEELQAHLQSSLPGYMIPAFFTSLEHLPLTPNGKIDRRALPDPSDLAETQREFLPPRSDFERKLAAIFAKTLNLPAVSVRDSFFDLGGHSLLAVQLFAEITDVFGKTLPLVTIFQAQTVELLASALQKEISSATWSPLVAIQTAGTRPPFFCVHSQGSSVLGYRALAEALGPDQPFYALQPRGLDGKSAPHERIEDMAADYIEELSKIDDKGPYYMGGICLGGIIALEMAQQLRAQGKQVGFLGLIDSHFPGQPKHLPASHFRSPVLWRIDRELGRFLHLTNGDRRSHIRRRLRQIATLSFKPKLPATLTKIVQANARAESYYVPQFYDGRVHLFWCSEWSFRAFQDRRLSWSEIAGEGLEVHVVPGDHESMRQPPHVAVLARKLNDCLERSRKHA
ncbi:MAG: amino acid adenylation domain-containing protein [Acidobacteriaceae bacterium]|nr:amino acid adenylation domain-containing protein [Acidobacteriaceae bacterium]